MELIVNITPDWGIGFENRLLVSISADLRRFRALTDSKTVVLGRKTLETFPGGRPLKNRTNIILTHDTAFSADPAIIVHADAALVSGLRKHPENWQIRRVSELQEENGLQFQYIDYVNRSPKPL